MLRCSFFALPNSLSIYASLELFFGSQTHASDLIRIDLIRFDQRTEHVVTLIDWKSHVFQTRWTERETNSKACSKFGVVDFQMSRSHRRCAWLILIVRSFSCSPSCFQCVWVYVCATVLFCFVWCFRSACTERYSVSAWVLHVQSHTQRIQHHIYPRFESKYCMLLFSFNVYVSTDMN